MLQTTFGAVSVEPADVADFLLGAPLRILAIVIIAWFVNRIARRGVKSTLRTLSSGAVQERVGSLRAGGGGRGGGGMRVPREGERHRRYEEPRRASHDNLHPPSKRPPRLVYSMMLKSGNSPVYPRQRTST